MTLELRAAVERDEGFSPTVYKDSVGRETIGFGFLVDRLSAGLSRDECRMILHDRLNKIQYEDLPKAFPWFTKLDKVRQEVLVNMAYNLGVGGLKGFKKALKHIRLLAVHSEAQAETRAFLAAEEMLDSKWAKQVGARAVRLAEQMKTGVRQ